MFSFREFISVQVAPLGHNELLSFLFTMSTELSPFVFLSIHVYASLMIRNYKKHVQLQSEDKSSKVEKSSLANVEYSILPHEGETI